MRATAALLVLALATPLWAASQLVAPGYSGTDIDQPSTSANVMSCYVWTPAQSITGATKLVGGITTGAALAVCGLAIYPDDDNGSVIAGSSNTCTAAGALNMTITPSFDIPAGTPIRVCACSSSTTVRLLSHFDFSTSGASLMDVLNVGAVRFGTAGQSCTAGSPPPFTGALSARIFQAFTVNIE